MADEPTRENPCGPIGTEVIFENEQVRVWDMQAPILVERKNGKLSPG